MLNVAVLGATGRMGREVVRAIAGTRDIRLVGATVRPGADTGADAGVAAGVDRAGVPLGDSPADAIASAEVAIDFTLATATAANLAACSAAGCALVIGVTGHDETMRGEIARAAKRIPVLAAANLSLGAGVLRRLAAMAAGALPEDYDVAILDCHHRQKRDAPSGTALALGEAVAASRSDHAEPAYAAIRAGDIVGDHSVIFAGRGERIELTHRVQSRSSFAAGALAAARWVAGRPPGLYGMDDLLIDQPARLARGI